MTSKLQNFTDVLGDPDEIGDSQPLSLSSVENSGQYHASSIVAITSGSNIENDFRTHPNVKRPDKGTGQCGEFRSVDEIDVKYRNVFSYPFFNLVQSRVLEDALYSDKSMVICAPTGSGKTVVFEMAIVRLLMEMEDRNENHDFKIIYMAPVKALCTERLTEWYSKFTKLGLLCIEVTGDTDVDFSQLKPYRIIITTPEKWDMLTRRWRDHRQLVEVIKLFLIDEVHILNDESRGPVLEAVVSRMKTIETSVQSTHRIEQLQQQYLGTAMTRNVSPSIRFVAVSATVSNPEDVATWLGTSDKPAVYYKFGDECRPVKLKRVVEGYHCAEGTSIFKFDLILNYKLWPIIQKYHDGKPTLIFCNTRKSVAMTAETLSREITISFNEQQRARLTALASTIKNKKLQTLVLSGVGCHHAGLLYEERNNIELAFRNRDLPILITTTTLAMGVNLPAHLVIIKNTQQYVCGAYQEYSISTVLQMVGRAGRPQFDTEATAVIMTRLSDKPRYQALVGGSEPLQSYLHKRLPENLNSEAALGTVSDVAQCVQWLRSTFLSVRAAQDPKRYLGLPPTAPHHHIAKKIEELCVKAMNGLASSGLITMDEACCIESTEAGRLMSIFYLDLETMKHIMKIDGSESLERLLWIVCESHELSDMHLRMDERRFLNALNRNNSASTIRFPMRGKITTRQMKLNCVIQAILGCLPIPDPSLNQEATKIMRIAERVCKCLVAYVTRPALVSQQPQYFSAVLNSIILAKCVAANLWENSPFVSKQLKGIGPTFSTLLATAGKVNFMLLEESHPRDLERIMNKGPPAGNILRKQISLFPKYQLTMTPVDEKVVSIQLVLLNHHNLSENMEHLTAGTAHKSYMILGDSENNLLLLTSFSDKDLIGVYDGSIAYQITRKHGFEHKIYAHCVSSTFAGIDAQCEYIFKDVDPQMYPNQSDISDDLIRKPVKKQTTITDTFRERKRKNTDSEIAQSKEKKKRESALFEKFKNLKESFKKTSKVLKNDLDKSAVMSQKILQELTHLEKDVPSAFHSTNVAKHNNKNNVPVKSTFFEEPTYEINDDDFMDDTFMNEDQINDILNNIESEITSKSDLCNKKKSNTGNHNHFAVPKTTMDRPVINANILSNKNVQIENNKTMNNKKRVHKNVSKKSNYNFIDLLEKDIDLSDTEETSVQEHNSFSDTIRSHIEKYLQKTETNIKPTNRVLDLISEEPVPSKEIGPIVLVHDSNVSGKEDNIGELGKTMGLRSNSDYNENVFISEGDKERTVDKSYQVTLLEHQIKSLGLTVDELQNTDRHNLQEIEGNELPAAKIHRNTSENDDNIAIDNVEGTMERRIIPEYTYTNTRSNINIETVSQPFRKMKPTNAINDQVDKLNEELHIKEQEKVLDEDVLDIDLGINYSGIDKDKTSVAIPSPIPLLEEKEKLPGIEQPNQTDNLVTEAENEKAYKDQLPTSYNIQTVIEQDLYDKPSSLPSTSYVPQINEKQDLNTLEMWKNYIKELPRLSFEQNNKEITAYNSPMTYDDIGNPKTSTKQVDNYQEQPVSQCPDVKEIQKNTAFVKSKNKGLGFIPPYKHPTDEPVINNYTQNREKAPSEATGALSRQLIHTPQPHQLALMLPKTASIPELQNKLLTIEQTHNNRTTAIQNCPAHTQLHYDIDKLKFNLPSTSRFTSEFQEQRPLDIQSTTSINKDVTKFNNPTICNIGNRLNFAEQNYDPSFTNNKEHYINKYSVISSKTDVLTQETADHVVRVIRNLRIDLDITEIVSKQKKSMGHHSGADIEGQIDRNEESLTVILKTDTPASDQSIEQSNGNTRAMQSANYSSGFGYGTKPLEQNNAKTRANSDDLPAVSNSSETETLQPIPATKHKQVISSGIEHRDIIQMDRDKKEDVNTFSKYKIEDISKENKPNNVMGILQKYSNIMRNYTRNSPDTQTQIKVTEKTSSVAKKDKSKKPFKISDIDRLNPAPLPSLLKEITCEPVPINVSECFNLLEPHDKLAQLERNKQLNIISDLSSPKEPLIEHKYNEEVAENESTNANLEDISYSDPYIEDLEVKDSVTNIDQTMFNPKTLLQCFSTEEPEDIVPPPPEFSDFFDTTITSADVTLPADSYEPMVWEEDIDEHRQEIHSRSIFQDESQVELTPSKEIETWNLSQDEGSCERYASSGSSPYSFTIIRKNKEQTYPRALAGSLLQNMTLPRHKRLQQFKFNHKNKFKM